MTSRLLELARGFAALTPEEVPADVRRIVRLQHLAAAGAAVAAGIAPGLPAAEHLTAARVEGDDFLAGGSSSLPLLPLLWAAAGGVSVERLISATVVGNELGARVGLLLSGSGKLGLRRPEPGAVAAAAGMAWLRGAGPDALAGAIASALANPGRLPGREAEAGDLAQLDDYAPLLGGLAPVKLSALNGLYLTRSLVVKSLTVADGLLVALEAVDEVLRRHVRAADKWLRCDQVEKIELRMALPAFIASGAALDGRLDAEAVCRSLPLAVGVLLARHVLGPGELSPAALAERADDIRHVASKVELRHDWALTLRAAAMVPAWNLDLAAARRRVGSLGALPLPASGDWSRLIRARPWTRLRDLLSSDPVDDQFSGLYPVELKLYTTRGGWWPERRETPRGTAAGGERESLARSRFSLARGDGARARRESAAERLLTADGTAAEFVAELSA